jgi:hypothetical protein
MLVEHHDMRHVFQKIEPVRNEYASLLGHHAYNTFPEDMFGDMRINRRQGVVEHKQPPAGMQVLTSKAPIVLVKQVLLY